MARMVSVGDTGAASPLLSGVRFRASHADRVVLVSFSLLHAYIHHVVSRPLVLSRLFSQARSRPPSVPAQSQGDVADPASFPARSGSLLVSPPPSPPHVTHARYDGYRESPCLLDRRLMNFGGLRLYTYAVPIPLAFRIAIYSLSCFASQSRLMIVS